MLIPGMLLMSCFFALCFFFVAFFFFCDVVFDLGFAFALLIPGILDMSCPGCHAETIDPFKNNDTTTKPTSLIFNSFQIFIRTTLEYTKVQRARPEPAPRSPHVDHCFLALASSGSP